MEDKRQFPRKNKPLSVTFSFFGANEALSGLKEFSGFVEDISISGVRIQIVDPYGFLYGKELSGKVIKCSLPFPHLDYTLVSTAIIQWVRGDKKNLNQTFSLGVQFRNLSMTDCQYLESYISSNYGDHNLLWDLWNQEVKP